MQRRASTSRYSLSLAFILCSLCFLSSVSAELGSQDDYGELLLNCDSDNDCSLSNFPSGEEVTGRQESSANPLNPKVVDLEFEMQPNQEQLALIPSELSSLSIDLRITEDVLGWIQPDLQVSLKIGPSENEWTIEGAGSGLQTQPSPYSLENEELDLSEGRLLHPGEQVKLRITFQLDRPATWELHLRGKSNLELDIIWSVNPSFADVDEPSSQSSPRTTNEVEIWHDGALVGDDRDCWKMSLESHELFNVIIVWDAVPIEVEQPHDEPDLTGPDNRNAPTPDVFSKYDGDVLSVTYQYRGMESGEYTICWSGMDDKFQSYSWMGRYTFEGIGPSSPDEFSGGAEWISGYALVGDSSERMEIEEADLLPLVFGMILLIGIIGSAAVQPNWNMTRRVMLPLAGVLVLSGGVIHPVMMWAEAIADEEALDIDELLQRRLEQIWQINTPGTPDANKAEQLGATFGILENERLLLDIKIDSVVPTGDGRYQIESSEIDGIRIDRLIFNYLNSVGAGHDGEGLLPQQSVNFILNAGHALALDLLILEALLVVDEAPKIGVLHIDWNMKRAGSYGGMINPTWATRPASVELSDWSRLQSSLFPDIITVSYCDCGLDQMDITWSPSSRIDANDLITTGGLNTPVGLGSSANILMFAGISLVLVTALVEYRRKTAARKLAEDFL